MKIAGIIPARYQSTRFPGKALADINGKSMVRRVYEQARKATTLSDVVVATDDSRIIDHVLSFGGKSVMTSEDCKNGTERCAEALKELKGDFDFVVNIQGDEPFIDPKQIELLCSIFNSEVQIATLAKKIESTPELLSSNVNKVILGKKNDAMYFSRTPIPYLRNIEIEDWIHKHTYYKHIGIYGYRTDVLYTITKLEPTPLEIAESLEQLRWLENGYSIKVAVTEIDSLGIDTPEDLERALQKNLA